MTHRLLYPGQQRPRPPRGCLCKRLRLGQPAPAPRAQLGGQRPPPGGPLLQPWKQPGWGQGASASVLPCLWGLWSLDSPHKPHHCSVSEPGNPGRQHKALFAPPEFHPGRPSRPGGDGKLGPKEGSQSSPEWSPRAWCATQRPWSQLAGSGWEPPGRPSQPGTLRPWAEVHSLCLHIGTSAVAPPSLSYHLRCQAGASRGPEDVRFPRPAERAASLG